MVRKKYYEYLSLSILIPNEGLAFKKFMLLVGKGDFSR
jgi:hypothetical protein